TLSIIPTVAAVLCRLTRNAETIAKVQSRIIQVQCTSAPIPMALRHRFMEKFAIPLQDCYGITELGGPLTFQTSGDAAAFGEAGVPLSEIAIQLRNAGELWIRSPYSMLGYLENGRLISPFDDKGFMNTGDLAEISSGKLHITGRVKDLVIRGGVNISSSKLESILSLMPEIRDVAVVGHEHEFWGEEIVACVIPAEDGWKDEERFFEYCAANLGAHERPDKVVFMDSFPRSFIGKLLKRELKDVAAQAL
ncbi:MAG: fatty acid--CoA ligase family protein, partial [Victivallales bacterium]|nr:fatty acid--CoA ligase family protein [Victivallales bacterium]